MGRCSSSSTRRVLQRIVWVCRPTERSSLASSEGLMVFRGRFAQHWLHAGASNGLSTCSTPRDTLSTPSSRLGSERLSAENAQDDLGLGAA